MDFKAERKRNSCSVLLKQTFSKKSLLMFDYPWMKEWGSGGWHTNLIGCHKDWNNITKIKCVADCPIHSKPAKRSVIKQNKKNEQTKKTVLRIFIYIAAIFSIVLPCKLNETILERNALSSFCVRYYPWLWGQVKILWS